MNKEILDKLEELKELLGTDELLNAITTALGTDELNDTLNYIIRMYDIENY